MELFRSSSLWKINYNCLLEKEWSKQVFVNRNLKRDRLVFSSQTFDSFSSYTTLGDGICNWDFVIPVLLVLLHLLLVHVFLVFNIIFLCLCGVVVVVATTTTTTYTTTTTVGCEDFHRAYTWTQSQWWRSYIRF